MSKISVKPLEWRYYPESNAGAAEWLAGQNINGQYFRIGRVTDGWRYGSLFYADITEAKSAAQADYEARVLSALEPQQEEAVAVERWRKNNIDTWAAMTAMRNSINEHIPMPSIEGDLLQGPENSVFCAAVADAVTAYVVRTNDLLESALYFVESKYEPAIDSEHELYQQLKSRVPLPTPAQKVQESQTVSESPLQLPKGRMDE